MLTAHNLKSNKTKKTAKRVGRGNASKGNYSGRGMKGQKSRTGVSGLKQRAIKSWLSKIPKKKGFNSPHLAKENVNLSDLQKNFSANSEVTPFILHKKNMIKNVKAGVKILGNGKLTKKLQVKVHAFSKTAKEAIEKVGGKAEIIERKIVNKSKKNKKDK